MSSGTGKRSTLGKSVLNNRILVIPVKLRRREVPMQDHARWRLTPRPTWRLLEGYQVFLREAGQTQTRIGEGTVRCHTGKYGFRNRTVQASLLTGFGMQSLIYQYGLLGFILSGFDPVPRQDSAVPVVFLLSSVLSEQLYMLEAFLFVCILQSIA